jgi:hypothetical protein
MDVSADSIHYTATLDSPGAFVRPPRSGLGLGGGATTPPSRSQGRHRVKSQCLGEQAEQGRLEW